jgi:hypothetical protein
LHKTDLKYFTPWQKLINAIYSILKYLNIKSKDTKSDPAIIAFNLKINSRYFSKKSTSILI